MSARTDVLDRYSWWTALKHGGLLIAPSKLAEHFEASTPPLPRYKVEWLRRAVVSTLDGNDPTALLDTVLEAILGLNATEWLKGPAVGSEWSRHDITRNPIKPRRLWQGPNGGRLPVFTVDAKEIHRLGVGRGRRSVSRVVEWLRQGDEKVALLTNGRQWRLVHAGSDYDAWCEWDIELWFEEGEPSPQVDALRQLLGARVSDARQGRRGQPARPGDPRVAEGPGGAFQRPRRARPASRREADPGIAAASPRSSTRRSSPSATSTSRRRASSCAAS